MFNKINQTIILIFLYISVFIISTKAQNIQDYFIPPAKFNSSKFYQSALPNEKIRLTKELFYKKIGNNFEVYELSKFDSLVTYMSVDFIQIVNNEVQILETKSSGFSEKHDKYSPPRVILKFPQPNKTITWTNVYSTGVKMKYTAKQTKVLINGIMTNVIVVEESYVNQPGFGGKNIIYYAKGIGFWKSEISADKKISPAWLFDKLLFDGDFDKN
jgi:hypothetical protein